MRGIVPSPDSSARVYVGIQTFSFVPSPDLSDCCEQGILRVEAKLRIVIGCWMAGFFTKWVSLGQM